MKKIIILFLFCQVNLIAQSSDYNIIVRDGLYSLFSPGYYYMLDSPVNVRLEPNLNSRIIGQLKLHERIEIIGSAVLIQQIDNIWAGWYKTKYGNDLGYIWGGYIAYKTLVFDIDKNGIDDYFYYRLRDVQSYIGFIDAWQDIFIYINNKKVSTKDLYPRNCSGCDFEINGDKILIYVSNSSEIRAEYNIFEMDKYGKIRFVSHFIE